MKTGLFFLQPSLTNKLVFRVTFLHLLKKEKESFFTIFLNFSQSNSISSRSFQTFLNFSELFSISRPFFKTFLYFYNFSQLSSISSNLSQYVTIFLNSYQLFQFPPQKLPKAVGTSCLHRICGVKSSPYHLSSVSVCQPYIDSD